MLQPQPYLNSIELRDMLFIKEIIRPVGGWQKVNLDPPFPEDADFLFIPVPEEDVERASLTRPFELYKFIKVSTMMVI